MSDRNKCSSICRSQNDVPGRDGTQPEPLVAVENVCAWPNLTLLPDDTVVAVIHNQPGHLMRPADVDCWASEDGGRTWNKRGTPAPRDNERAARANVAAGPAGNGDLIVIASGWADPAAEGRGGKLSPIVSRSADGGRTWEINDGVFAGDWPKGYLVPFGDIMPGKDGRLRVGMYGAGPGGTFVYSSPDDGRTWEEPVPISEEAVIHEPALFHLGEGRWLAAARLDGLDLYRSDDDATTWVRRCALTGQKQHPGHFMRLDDGRLILTYGNREPGSREPKPYRVLHRRSIEVLFSDDEGENWSEPLRVADVKGDCGYPSTVQLSDGRALTAYYGQTELAFDPEGFPERVAYRMEVVAWDPAAGPEKMDSGSGKDHQ